ncbi:MAG: carboxypeptidase regulatory-like domain-containing protein, partial [Planctomycetia bacterium]|nr:carboxypeptidase regulatory-like domain-containing protein [Planctomycetia bacterium]
VVGRVVDAAGRAVAGVRVHAFPEGRERDSALCPPEAAADGGAAASTTDADGGYRLPIVPASAKGPAPLTVVAQRPDVPGPRHGDVVVEVEAGRTARAPDLVVVGPSEPAAAHVVVRVLDANGGALAGATAVADGDPGAAFRAPRSGRDGRVRVALPRRATPDAALSLVVRAPAHGPATLHVPTDAADGATFDVTLTRGHVVAGRVRFADGRPAALAWVWAYDATDSVGDFLDRVDSAPSGGARTPPPRALSLVPTDADGRFRFDDLPAGAFHLTAHAPETRADGPPPAVVRTVPTGTTDVDLRFAPVEATAGPVTLRVVDAATGRPIVAATVVFEPAAPPADAPEAHDAPALYRFVDGQFVPRTTAPTPAPRAPGDFVTSGGRPGPYDVVVRAPGYLATRLGGVSVGPEGATLPTVRLSRGVHVHGRVAWPEGDAGVDRVVTFVRDDDGDDAPIVAPVIDGAFDASGFRPGRYRVRSDPPPGRRGRPVPLLRADDARVVVPPARDEVVADLAFVAAGTLRVRCGDPRLPPADWTGGKASAAQAEVGRRSAVTITTSAGAVVHRIAPLPRGVPLDEGTLLVLPGDYVVRLEGPDDVGAERRVTVGAGAWVDVELGRPANR